MFSSWRRSSPKPLNQDRIKKRSIPVPLKDHSNTSDFKNSTEAKSSEPSDMAKPEFSRVKSMASMHTLRRYVRPASETSPPQSKHPSPSPASASASAAEQQQQNTDDGQDAQHEAQQGQQQEQPQEQPQDRWIWSIFKTDKRPKQDESTQSKGGAWAFWTRDNSTGTLEEGKLAVSGTETENMPRKAELELPQAKKRRKSIGKPSIVVPQFETVPRLSRASRLASLFWSSGPRQHLVQQAPTKPKRALVIGVHGYFPTRMSRAILGEPTGTSIKFANEAEARLQAWYTQHYPDSAPLQIDKIALEGEGKIAHRVDKLYKLLLNWESLLKNADFVFFAVHSQGAVVTLNIVARLIEQRMLATNWQHVSILSMAGSLLGPMPGMDQTLVMKAITRIEHDSLIELFQFQDVNSPLSIELQQSATTVLNSGVKVVLVGSADDQLIPLYSSLAVNMQHPNLFRAVYIDGDDVMPDVVAPMLQLATQQLNLGQSDHGVISEISGILAGALTSKGHSKLYSSDTVYDLGLRIALETAAATTATNTATAKLPQFETEFRIPRPTGNPFLLPWAANALLSESRRFPELTSVVNDLLAQFNAWKPETKQMKELKLRLAGISRISKL